MATWTIRIPARDISITTAQLEAVDVWFENLLDRGGPGASGDLLRERILFDTRIIPESLESILIWELEQRGVGSNWRLNGSIVSALTGTGIITDNGQGANPAEFQDTTGPFTPASNPVGKIIQIPGGQGAGLNAARGRYLITARVNNQRVNIEGVFPTTVSGLDWNYCNFGNTDAIAILSVE